VVDVEPVAFKEITKVVEFVIDEIVEFVAIPVPITDIPTSKLLVEEVVTFAEPLVGVQVRVNEAAWLEEAFLNTVIYPSLKFVVLCPQPFTTISNSATTVINFLKDLWPKKELEILFGVIKIVLNTSANKQFLAKHLIKFRLSIYYF